MKNKKQYIEEYIEYLYGDIEEHERLMYAPDIQQSKKDFEMGFYYGQPKWISVDKQLPDDDRTVLVWINDTENPQWSGYKLGAYLNEKWYCNGGRESHEIVTDWCQTPARKK